MALVARPRGPREPGPGAALGEAAGITAGKRVLDRTAAQPRRATPDLYPLDPWCDWRFSKAPQSWAPFFSAPSCCGREFSRRDADGETASDAVVATWRGYAQA